MNRYAIRERPHDWVATIPRPSQPPEPSFMTAQDGVPLIYGAGTAPVCGIRLVHASNPKAPSARLGVSLLYVPPQAELPLHDHEAEETYIVSQGSGEMLFRDGSRAVSPGDFVYLPSYAEHGIRNTGPEMLVVILALSPQNP